MRKFVAQFLVLTLISLNSYAGPFNLGPRERNRPDLRPGDRGSIAQEALGSSQDQYSILNPGSNQSVFIRNTFLLSMQNAGSFNANGYTIFNPQVSLPGSTANLPLDAITKNLLESNGDNALAYRVAQSPFSSKVAKSQTQGMVFVGSARLPNQYQNLESLASYPTGARLAVAEILRFEIHKNDPTNIPIGTPIGLMLIAAGLLFLPIIITVTDYTIFDFGPNDSLGQDVNLVANKISALLEADGAPPQEARRVSQAAVLFWMVAYSVKATELPANVRNEIGGYFQEACSTCAPQMINAAFNQSEKLVLNAPTLRLSESQLNDLVAKMNSAIKSADKINHNRRSDESSKDIFIKTLQGKNITLEAARQ